MSKRLAAGQQVEAAMSEAELCAALEEALALGGWLFAHHPDSRKLHGDPGLPDYVAVNKSGVVQFIEAKTRSGKVSKDQVAWIDRLDRNEGNVYAAIVRPAELGNVCRMLVAGQPIRSV